MKKWIALILCLVMCLQMLPMPSSAEDLQLNPPACDSGCNTDTVGTHQQECAVKVYYRDIYSNCSAQELCDQRDAFAPDAWEFLVSESWNLDSDKAQTLNALMNPPAPSESEDEGGEEEISCCASTSANIVEHEASCTVLQELKTYCEANSAEDIYTTKADMAADRWTNVTNVLSAFYSEKAQALNALLNPTPTPSEPEEDEKDGGEEEDPACCASTSANIAEHEASCTALLELKTYCEANSAEDLYAAKADMDAARWTSVTNVLSAFYSEKAQALNALLNPTPAPSEPEEEKPCCSSTDANIADHEETCTELLALKAYCEATSAHDIYAARRDMDSARWGNITNVLAKYDSEKYQLLQSLISGIAVPVDTVTDFPACSGAPDCYGGQNGSPLNNHTQSCARREYVLTYITGKEPASIANDWSGFSSTERTDIMSMVEAYWSLENVNTLKDLVGWGAPAPDEPDDTPFTETVNGQTITASGDLPEGARLKVTTADSSAECSRFGLPGVLFAYDISVQQDDADWQPGEGEAVLITLTVDQAPGTKIGLIHTHNGGTPQFLGVTEVSEDNTVSFYTDSFSTFAGFTVDFHYEGVDFSIEGLTSITLANLFTNMGIQEDASAATSVVFSNETLVQVTQENGEWVLTSLDAFSTNETLIITFDGGRSIVIDVTDLDTNLTFSNSDVKGHFSHGIYGAKRYKIYLYSGDNSSSFDSSNRVSSVPANAWLDMTSNTYWFEIKSVSGGSEINNRPYDPPINIIDKLNAHSIAFQINGVSLDVDVHIKCWPRTISTKSTSKYCYVKQAEKLVDAGDKTTRNVEIWVIRDGVSTKEETFSNIVFPVRPGDANGHDVINAERDLSTPSCAPGYRYVRREDNGVDTYRIYVERIPYSISYTMNQGELSTGVTNPTGYHVETSTFTLNNPTRTGYEFKGWTGSNGNTPQTTITIKTGSTGDRNYTANWVPISYNVSFNGNGATGGSIANQSFTYDTAQNLTANAYKREYTVTYNTNGGNTIAAATAKATFNGWEDHGAIVYKGTSYAYPTFDAPFYANFYRDLMDAFGYNKYNLLNHWVTYTVNGSETRVPAGDGYALYPDQANVNNLSTTAGYTVPLYANWTLGSVTLPNATRNGYTFDGWYADEAYTTKVGNAGASYTPTAATTLYAKWTAIEYTATFIGERGEKDQTTTFTIETGLTFPDHSNKQFDTWQVTEKEGNWVLNATYEKGVTVNNMYGDVTFTPQFSNDNTYNVSYAYTGDIPTGAPNPPTDASNYRIGDTVTVANAPTLTGYAFSGWGAEGLTITNGTFTMPGHNLPLTGSWTANTDAGYTVRYVEKDSDPEVEIQTATTVTGKTYNQIYSETAPAIEGFTVATGESPKEVTASYDATITFHYTRNAYDIHYINGVKSDEPEGSKNVTNMPETNGDIPYKASVTVTAVIPERPGYTFKGWTSTDVTIGTDNKFTMPAKNITLTAQWEEKTATIHYAAKENGTVSSTNEQVLVWTGTPTGSTPTPAAGYKFEGWYEDEACTKKVTTGVDSANKLTPARPATGYFPDTITYYAKFEQMKGNLKLVNTTGTPAVITVDGNITLVLTGEMIIADLPVGSHTVSASGFTAGSSASVDNGNPEITDSETTTVNVTAYAGSTSYFTQYDYKVNKPG